MTIQALLETRLREALPADANAPQTLIAAATDSRFGDYQSNVAMQLARERKMNPRQLATEIQSALRVEDLC